MITRRKALQLMGAAAAAANWRSMATSAGQAGSAPAWAQAGDQASADLMYTDLKRRCAADGRDLRSFGAKLDGSNDDSAALEKALASDAKVILIGGDKPGAVLRLTRQLRIEQPLILAANGAGALLRWEGKEQQPLLLAAPGGAPTEFVRDVWIDGLGFENADPKPRGHALRAVNARGLKMTRCSTRRMGGISLTHALDASGRYQRSGGGKDADPAVAAGFSAHGTGDLNEDVLFADNRIDGGAYMVQALRFQFAKRVTAVRNTGMWANITWWGGGARMTEGGATGFLRRVESVYIADNELSNALGGIYGNNGRDILVERNKVSRMMDAGIDFEGCMDVLARNNTVLNCGNYCYSVFFSARNVRFIDNIAVQDGSAEGLAGKLGADKPLGTQKGRAVFALRSAGFGGQNDAIDVELSGNQFTWSGASGFGVILPSYAGKVALRNNKFRNVTCDLRYKLAGRSEITGNDFLFDHAAESRTALVAVGGNGNGGGALIADNHIVVRRAQPAGSSVILANADDRVPVNIEIRGNRIAEDGDAQVDFPILLDGPNGGSRFQVKDNQTRAIMRTPGTRAAVEDSGNQSAGGAKAEIGVAP